MSNRTRLTLLFILLLACGLRVYDLDSQSIWYDEGLSLYLAQQSPAQAIALSATTDHPPLHALLLGAWLRLAGESDFVVRFLSVVCGVLVVALTFVLGRMIDQRAGLIAAFLLAIAPFAVYYSQETRGYMLLTALTLAATLAAARLINGDRRRRIWIAYLATMVAALYTHYFATFTWAALFFGFCIAHLARRRAPGTWLKWVAAQAAIALLFLPWLPNAIAQAGSNATYFPGRVTWQTVFGDTWRAFTAGEWGDASLVGWLWLILSAIGVMAVLAGNIGHGGTTVRRDTNVRALSLNVSVAILWLSLIIIPLVLMSALAWLKPKFAPRYLLPALPALIALAAMGVTRLIGGLRSRYRHVASLGLVAALALPLVDGAALLQLYIDPALARPDIRSVVGYIEANSDPSDAIILIGGHQAPAFNHYYHGRAAVIPMPTDLLPAAQSPLDARSIGQLAGIAAKHPRIWLVLWQSEISDPTNVILGALMSQAARLNVGRNFHGMGVLLFDVRAAKFEAAPQHTVSYQFAQPLRLVGYNVDTSRMPIDTGLRFGLYLQADGPINGNYQIFTHLVGSDGSLIAQADHIAGADSYPTSLWHPGNLVLNQFEMKIPAGTLPGEYHVSVGLYDSIGRLRLADGRDQIDLFTITIMP